MFDFELDLFEAEDVFESAYENMPIEEEIIGMESLFSMDLLEGDIATEGAFFEKIAFWFDGVIARGKRANQKLIVRFNSAINNMFGYLESTVEKLEEKMSNIDSSKLTTVGKTYKIKYTSADIKDGVNRTEKAIAVIKKFIDQMLGMDLSKLTDATAEKLDKDIASIDDLVIKNLVKNEKAEGGAIYAGAYAYSVIKIQDWKATTMLQVSKDATAMVAAVKSSVKPLLRNAKNIMIDCINATEQMAEKNKNATIAAMKAGNTSSVKHVRKAVQRLTSLVYMQVNRINALVNSLASIAKSAIGIYAQALSPAAYLKADK